MTWLFMGCGTISTTLSCSSPKISRFPRDIFINEQSNIQKAKGFLQLAYRANRESFLIPARPTQSTKYVSIPLIAKASHFMPSQSVMLGKPLVKSRSFFMMLCNAGIQMGIHAYSYIRYINNLWLFTPPPDKHLLLQSKGNQKCDINHTFFQRQKKMPTPFK